MADRAWLSDDQWAVFKPFMPKGPPGPERKDDRQIISGILRVLTSSCRWRDCPTSYGPHTTIRNQIVSCPDARDRFGSSREKMSDNQPAHGGELLRVSSFLKCDFEPKRAPDRAAASRRHHDIFQSVRLGLHRYSFLLRSAGSAIYTIQEPVIFGSTFSTRTFNLTSPPMWISKPVEWRLK